jgi:hypothetical protein
MKIKVGMKEWFNVALKTVTESLYIKTVFIMKELLITTPFTAKVHFTMDKIGQHILDNGLTINLME